MPTGDVINIHSERRASASKIDVRSGGNVDAGNAIPTNVLAHGTLAIFLPEKYMDVLIMNCLVARLLDQFLTQWRHPLPQWLKNNDNNDRSHHNHSLIGQIVIIYHHHHSWGNPPPPKKKNGWMPIGQFNGKRSTVKPSLNGHLAETESRVGPCLSLFLIVDSL